MNSIDTSLQQFGEDGDLLNLTRNHPEAKLSKFELPWKNCHAHLLDTGVLLVEPLQKVTDLKNIVISAGVHGNETAPIEILNQITKDIALGNLEIQHRVLLIIGNPLAMVQGKRFLHENLNRLFSLNKPREQENVEYLRSLKLKSLIDSFFNANKEPSQLRHNNFHYDLHTAIRDSVHEKFAIYPHKEDKSYSLDQLQFLRTSGINTVLFSHAPASTFSYYSSKLHGAHAFTIELGKVRKFGENDMGKFTKISKSLRCLMEGKSIATKPFLDDDFNLFEVCHEVIRTSKNFRFFMEDNVQNFTSLPDNTLLWKDNDTDYRTVGNQEAIVFPNPNVPIGQRVVLVIKPARLN